MSTSARRDLLVVACAVSAGVHAALAPAHFRESFAEGAGFVAAAALLAAVVGGLAVRPRSRAVTLAAALVFGGLLVSYLLATTAGVEAVDSLGIDTKLVELLGLALAVDLSRRRVTDRVMMPALVLTGMIAVFSALAALMLAGGHHHT